MKDHEYTICLVVDIKIKIKKKTESIRKLWYWVGICVVMTQKISEFYSKKKFLTDLAFWCNLKAISDQYYNRCPIYKKKNWYKSKTTFNQLINTKIISDLPTQIPNKKDQTKNFFKSKTTSSSQIFMFLKWNEIKKKIKISNSKLRNSNCITLET